MFNDLTTDNLEQAEDRVGGFSPFDSDIHTGKIKAFYGGQSPGGAKFIALIVAMGSQEYRETIYVTNRQGQNFFHPKDKSGNRDTSKKVPLPGFTIANDIALVTAGKELAQLDFEDKVINVYDFDAKKELPKSVPMAMELIDEQVSLGILQLLESKKTKQGDEYVATGEDRTVNNINKVFHTESQMTVVEAQEGADAPTFWDKWLAKNKGQVQDRRDKNPQAGNAGRPPKPGAAPASSSESASPAKSLFNKK